MGADFTFVHCADLHLGSRFYAVTEQDPALGKKLYDAVYRSFSNIVDLAKEKADFMVIAGDVYDEANETPRTRLFFAGEMKRLGKPCIIVRGNHDFKHSWDSTIPYPKNVYVMREKSDRCGLDVRGRRVDIVGASYATQHTSENLAAGLRGTPGTYTIGLLHCSVEGHSENQDYAPCSVRDLVGKDVDYWALGHIHKREVVRGADPWIVYPGNIQGRFPKETGQKGCYLVSVTGDRTEAEFVPAQDVLWKDVDADITWMRSVDELLDRIAPECPKPGNVICLHVKGRGPLSHTLRAQPEALTSALARRTGCSVDLREMACTSDIDLDRIRRGETLQSEVVRTAEEIEAMTDEQILDLLCSEGPAKEVRGRMKYFADTGALRRIAGEAKLALLDRLGGEQ